MNTPVLPAGLPLAPSGPVQLGEFQLDMDQARLSRGGEPQPLNGRALQVLALLAAQPGRLVGKDEMLDAIWGHRHVTESVLKGVVNVLRLALGDEARTPRYIETVPRRGYRLVAAVQPLGTPAAAAQTAPVVPPQTPAPAAPRWQALLPEAAALIGREEERAQLLALLAEARLVTLTGLGGMGKTSLALAVARAMPAPPDGVWLQRLDDLADPALLLPTLASLLNLGQAAAGSAEALARALGGQQLLLVLDNAEHLVEAVAELVAALLRAAPGVRLLVTSQLPLRLSAERVVPLAPLGLPGDVGDSAPAHAGYAAARLLCRRIAEQRPGWQPTAADDADIAAICRSLDGVPLALELAAARVPLLGLAGVRARLDERFALLTRAARDATLRHRTLAAALDWTFSLLTPAEREAMQRLAVFAGSFGVDDAEGVLQGLQGLSPLDVIDDLHQRALIVSADDHGQAVPRLRLYDSVRRHALAELGSSGREADARRRHLAWMLRRMRPLYQRAVFEPQQAWLPQLQPDVDSLRAALAHGLSPQAPADDQRSGIELAACSLHFWYYGGRRAEGDRWRQLAQEAASRHPLDARLQGLLDFASADFVAHSLLGSPAEALQTLRRAQPALAEAGDRLRLYMSRYAEFQMSLRVEGAIDRRPLLQALQAELDPGWPRLAGRFALVTQAMISRDAGDLEAYLAQARSLVQLARSQGAAFEVGLGAAHVGQALQLLGRADEACDHYAAAVDEARAGGWLRIRLPMVVVGVILALRRRLDDDSRARAVEALRLLGADHMAWRLGDGLCWAAWHDGRPADAMRLAAWSDAQMAARQEPRSAMYQRLRDELQALLQGSVPPGDASALSSEAEAIDLALGPGAAARVLPAA